MFINSCRRRETRCPKSTGNLVPYCMHQKALRAQYMLHAPLLHIINDILYVVATLELGIDLDHYVHHVRIRRALAKAEVSVHHDRGPAHRVSRLRPTRRLAAWRSTHAKLADDHDAALAWATPPIHTVLACLALKKGTKRIARQLHPLLRSTTTVPAQQQSHQQHSTGASSDDHKQQQGRRIALRRRHCGGGGGGWHDRGRWGRLGGMRMRQG